MRRSYSISSFSLTADKLFRTLKKRYPEFKVKYQPDFRENIASQWPSSINIEKAERHWSFECDYDYEMTIKQMLADIEEHH